MNDDGRWNHAKWQTIFTFLLVIIGAIYTAAAIFQWWSMKEQARVMDQQLEIMKAEIESGKASRSADFILRFDERLTREPFQKIRSAIENGKPILKAHGGKFSEDDLEGYLDILDSLNDVYSKGVISKDLFYNSYSYDIENAYDNSEVKAYLKDIRKEDPDFYSGFEKLAIEMKQMKPRTNP